MLSLSPQELQQAFNRISSSPILFSDLDEALQQDYPQVWNQYKQNLRNNSVLLPSRLW
jgi:hypothetical protein